MTGTPEISSSGFTRTRHLRRRVVGAAAATSILCAALVSCATPDEEEPVSAAGEKGSVGALDLLSIVLVSSAEGEPGRLLGTVENESDESVDLTISDSDDEVTITVPAGEEYRFDDNETVLGSADDAPGAVTTITAATDAETAELLVPVHDGTLEQFRPYLPE